MKRLFLTLCFALTACQSAQDVAKPSEAKLPVLVKSPNLKDVSELICVLGELHPTATVDVRPQVDGKVVKVFVKEGQWVEKGTPLFLIDTKPLSLKVQEAEAELAKEEALGEKALKKLERFQSLANKELISKSEWDEIESEVAVAKTQIALAAAHLNTNKLNLKRCLIKSTIKGRIGKLDVHPGHIVANLQSTPLVQIATLDPLICEYKLTEKEFKRLSVDTCQLEIESLALPGTKLSATTTFVDNHFDPKSGQILLRAKVENKHYEVRPGQVVRVRIPVAIMPQATLIKQRALKHSVQGPYVYVVKEDQTAETRPLKLGIESGDEIVVLEGLSPTDLVVTEGHEKLYPGAKVEIKS